MSDSPPRDPRANRLQPSEPDLSLKFLMSDVKAQSLSVSHTRQLSAATGARLSLSSPNSYFPESSERTVLLSGPLSSLTAALTSLISLINDSLLHVIVPEKSVPLLLLNNGALLRSMGMTTGNNLSLLPPVTQGFDERVVRLSGQALVKGAIQLAHSLMLSGFTISDQLDYRTMSHPQAPGHVSGFGSTHSSPSEAPKSRIEALRDQLLKLAKVEQTARQPEPAISFPQAIPSVQRNPPEWTGQAAPFQPPHQHMPVTQIEPVDRSITDVNKLLQNAAEIAAANHDILDMECVVKMPQVPNRFCSAVIGSKGINVREIQDATGARVQVAGSEQFAHYKDISVTGQVQQVHAALMAICDIMLNLEMGVETGRSGERPSFAQWLRQSTNPPPQQRPQRPELADRDFSNKRTRY